MICDRNDNGICKSPWCYHKSAGGTCLNPRFKFNPTNADRIRGMTDEELAAERIEFNYNPNGADYYSGDFGHHNIFYNNGVMPPGAYQEAFKKELDWLRQPAKEEV